MENDFFDFDNDQPDVVEKKEPVVKAADNPNPPINTDPEPPVEKTDFSFDADDDDSDAKPDPLTGDSSKFFDTLIAEAAEDDVASKYITKETLTSTSDIIAAIKKAEEDSLQSFIETALEEDPKVGNFLNFLRNKGSIDDLLAHYKENPSVAAMPFETVEDKQAILKVGYAKEGKSEEEIEIIVKALTDNSKIDSVSERVRKSLLDAETNAITNAANKAKQDADAVVEQRKKEKEQVSALAKTVTEVNGIKIDATDKLVSFVSDYKFKNASNKEFTEFDVKLDKALKEPKTKLLIAQLLMTDFKNLSSLKAEARKEIIKQGIDKSSSVISPVVKTGDKTQNLDAFYDFIKPK